MNFKENISWSIKESGLISDRAPISSIYNADQ